MLFNSFEFIFIFLPVTLFFFYFFGSFGLHRIAVMSLLVASMVFYAQWNTIYLFLLLGSIFFNFSAGFFLGTQNPRTAKYILILGIAVNLALLGVFKYTNFIVDQVRWFSGPVIEPTSILLPLAISFFTFQQIAYLVDSYQGETREYNFSHYALFVMFFPQLIAGPIVHHKDLMPQFLKSERFRLNYDNFSAGVIYFTLGVFKKVVIADGLGSLVNPMYEFADKGGSLTTTDAWLALSGYGMQLYFDFSGYSEMAIGLGKMLNINLPKNFISPYKAANIIDFWRRWHITLSNFLRDYLYFPLGGNRHGKFLRFRNLFLTMLLGGIWHGAGWNFAIWGALHGFYLIINHLWRAFTLDFFSREKILYKWLSTLLTFAAVLLAWAFFRSVTLKGGLSLVQSALFMGDAGGLKASDYFASTDVWFLAFSMALAFFGKNAHEIVAFWETNKGVLMSKKKSLSWAFGLAAMFTVVIFYLNKKTEFLYFQF